MSTDRPIEGIAVFKGNKIQIVKEQVGGIANLPGFAGVLQVRALHDQRAFEVDGSGLAVLPHANFCGFGDAVEAQAVLLLVDLGQ